MYFYHSEHGKMDVASDSLEINSFLANGWKPESEMATGGDNGVADKGPEVQAETETKTETAGFASPLEHTNATPRRGRPPKFIFGE